MVPAGAVSVRDRRRRPLLTTRRRDLALIQDSRRSVAATYHLPLSCCIDLRGDELCPLERLGSLRADVPGRGV